METILLNIGLWIVGVLGVTAAMMAWFTTNFPQHVFEIAKKCGYKKDDPDFFIFKQDVGGFAYSEKVGQLTPENWDEWITEGPFGEKHPYLAELATCHGCFSIEVSIWLGLIIALASGQYWLFPIGAISWSVPARILLKKI